MERYPLSPKNDEESRAAHFYRDSAIDHFLAWYLHGYPHYHLGYSASASARSHRADATVMTELVCSLASIRHGDRVLDLGCGLGGTAVWICKRHNAGVVGISNDIRMLVKAQRFAKDNCVEHRALFSAGTLRQPPFLNSSFDVIIAHESLCHISSPSEYYPTLASLLKPGGRLVVADYFLRSRNESEDVRTWKHGWALSGLTTLSTHTSILSSSPDLELRDTTDITPNVGPCVTRLSSLATRFETSSRLLTRLGIRTSLQHAATLGTIGMGLAYKNQQWTYNLIRCTSRR